MSRARHFVAEQAGSLSAEVIDTATLLVSELVTNAVKHGQPAILLTVTQDPPLINVTVSDEGTSIPSTRVTVPAATAASGRGLLIVDRLASQWGIIANDGQLGKTVWFRLTAGEA